MILLSFLFSGFAGLIYQVVWQRLLGLSFGTTVSATAVTVAAFMAGLGLGSIYFGKKVDHSKKPLRIFSLLQLGIALSSFALIIILPRLPLFYSMLYRSCATDYQAPTLVIFICAFVLMVIPSFLIGGTFPVMTRAYIPDEGKIGKGIGKLYALNTLGGIIGAGFAGFFSIGQWGMSTTQAIAIIVNLILAIITFTWIQPKIVTNRTVTQVKTWGHSGTTLKFILIIAGLTGFIGLSYEILWIRALSTFLTNSTYTFTTVLIVFLAGITIGSLLFTKFLEPKGASLVTLGLAQGSIATYAIVLAPFLKRLPEVLFLMSDILQIPMLRIFLPGLTIASIVMLVPAILMGISFPLICKIYNRQIATLGEKMGLIYSFNTVGSTIGPLVAGLVLLPLLGVVKAIVVIAFINLFISIAILMMETPAKEKKRWLVPGTTTAVIAGIFGLIAMENSMLLPASIFRTRTRADRILYYQETRDGTVLVAEDRFTKIRACYINNSAVCGTTYDALKIVKMLGHLPLLIKPEAREALVIGFGIGITTSAIAQHNLQAIDCVEICPGVKEAAKYFVQFNNAVFRNPKINFIAGDGRNYLLLTSKKYDLISCDPTHPTLGCGNLYTREYFQLCKDRLNEDGIICQYLPFHKLSSEEFRSLIKTFVTVFEYATIWLGHSHGLLLAGNKRLMLDFQELKERLRALNDDILNDPYIILTSFILDGDGVKEFTKDAKINTDNHPYLEFFGPKSLRNENWEDNIAALLAIRADLRSTFYKIEDDGKLLRYLNGQKHFIAGLIYQNRLDRQNMLREFKKAYELNPENREIKMFLENGLKAF